MKAVIAILVVVAVGIAGYYVWNTDRPQETADQAMEGDAQNDSSAALRAEENAVMVFEQKPGSVVSGTVYLAAPGYLVIHEDNNGNPGAIIGSSGLLEAGENAGVKVNVSRPMEDGEMLHAMLHFEKGGNTSFSGAEDTPVPSMLGGPISGWFEVTSSASEQPPISI